MANRNKQLASSLALSMTACSIEIDVMAIDLNPYQPRQTITSESIQTIARSMEKDGQIAPIIVITQGDRYLLWDGQRRWSAAKLLGWKTLRAVKALMP